MRIIKVTGLQISSVELIKYTNERDSVIDYLALTSELSRQQNEAFK